MVAGLRGLRMAAGLTAEWPTGFWLGIGDSPDTE